MGDLVYSDDPFSDEWSEGRKLIDMEKVNAALRVSLVQRRRRGGRYVLFTWARPSAAEDDKPEPAHLVEIPTAIKIDDASNYTQDGNANE